MTHSNEALSLARLAACLLLWASQAALAQTEIIVDNANSSGITLTGAWTASTATREYQGSDYLHDNNEGKGTKSIVFTPNLTAGSYQVSARWVAFPANAVNVPVTITHGNGSASVTLNQQTNGGQWVLLGTYNFVNGQAGNVRFNTTGTSGKVIVDAVRFAGSTATVTIDNTDSTRVARTGVWASSSTDNLYEGTNYLHDGNTAKGTKSVRFTPTLPSAGSYAVYAKWASHANRGTAVPFSVTYQGGTASKSFNQRLDGGKWNHIGTYSFSSGTAGYVTVSNSDNTGYAIADAVRFLPAISDSDGDGMPDGWEIANGLNPNSAADAASDPDGDGQSNAAEYQMGLNPNSFNSAGTLTLTALNPSAYELEQTAGRIRITRTGGVVPTTINFALSGTASPADYSVTSSSGAPLSGSITLGYQSNEAIIVITPALDSTPETPESLTATVQTSPFFTTNSPTNASVTIYDATNIPANETLFVAPLVPPSGVNSAAAGIGLMYLNGSKTSARIHLSFNGLTSGQTNSYVRYGVTSGTGPELRPNLGIGQLTDVIWNIAAVPPYSQQNIIDGLFRLGGKFIYTNIGTASYPAGEIQGTWTKQTGSTLFTPPAAPPAIPTLTGDELTRDAARFLTQATFGPTQAEITALVNRITTQHAGDRLAAYSAWIDEQLAMDQTLHSAYTRAVHEHAWAALGLNPYTSPPDSYVRAADGTYAWWTISAMAKDQLRQRFAFALSEIHVLKHPEHFPEGYTHYYDTLGKYATGRFRDLLEDVSKHPMMGLFLSSLYNRKKVVDANGNTLISPDENYAREIMQLFSIGIVQLHPDGSLKLDGSGQAIPTYNNNDIANMARVFTGWSFGKTIGTQAQGYPVLDNNSFGMNTGTGSHNYFPVAWMNPMKNFSDYHDTGSKLVLGVTIPAGLSGEADLDAALDIVSNHANVGPFICRQLIQRLVTSNPSQGYIHRVSQRFNNNGSGVRGDMKAVIKAILLDYEARTPSLIANVGYGKQKEPIIRYMQMLRACGGKSSLPLTDLSPYLAATQMDNFPSGTTHYRYGKTSHVLEQTPLFAPSVFNFFLPSFSPGGAISAAGLVAPEMQITTEISTYNALNFFRILTAKPEGFTGPFAPPGGDTVAADIKLDFAPFVALYDARRAAGDSVAQATTALLDQFDLLLISGNFKVRYGSAPNPNPRSIIVTEVSGMALTTTLDRVRELLYLVIATPEFIHQK